MGYSNNDTLEQWDLRNVYFSNRYSNDESALKSDLLDLNNFHCFDLYFEGKFEGKNYYSIRVSSNFYTLRNINYM